MALSDSEVDLAAIAAQGSFDWALDQLLRYSRGGIGAGITVVVAGTVISGEVVPAPVYGEYFDRVLDEGLERAGTSAGDETGFEELRTQLREKASMASAAKESMEHELEIHNKLEALSEDAEIPSDLHREAVKQAAHLTAFTLRNAYVFSPNLVGGHMQIEMVRVLTRNVGAWWLGTTVPTGQA